MITTTSPPATAVTDDSELTVPELGTATGDLYEDATLARHRQAHVQVVGRVREVWRWGDPDDEATAERELTQTERIVAELRSAGVPSFNEVPVHEPPALTGNLVTDVCVLCGLSRDALADAFGVTNRTVYNWQRDGAPRDQAVVRRLRAMRSIAITLYGGLGADGVRLWLHVGEPSRLERLVTGVADEIVVEARAGLGGVAEG
jgi:DNA-binding transcriptional regulator YiaG